MKFDLHDHQARALDMLKDSLRSGCKRPLVQAPTGFGKTLLAAAIVEGALSKGKRIIFTVPTIDLVDQTVDRFAEQGISSVGVLQGHHPATDATQPVQVATLQTLERRRLPQSDVVVIDEAHLWRQFVGRWMAMEGWEKVPFIGLSAKPWTKGLGKFYDDLIIAETTAGLIERGFLSRFRTFAPSHPDLSKVRTVAGDFRDDDLSDVMSQPRLVADVVATWLQLGEDRPTLCFAVDRAHARKLAGDFERAGVPTGYVDGETPRDEREATGRRLAEGQIRVVCNVGVLTTGIDWDIRCIVLARPTKSEMLFTQIVGRGLRTADGKDDCLVRGTLVLTDTGEVPIEHLTTEHKVWDGRNFVRHAGAICKGVRPVISHDGVTGTPDHEVMTDEGWKSLAEAHRRRMRISRTGMGRTPLRFVGDRIPKGGGFVGQAACRGVVRALFGASHGAFPQHQEATQYGGLPSLQRQATREGASLAKRPLPFAEATVRESFSILLRAVWRAWDRVLLFHAARCRELDCRELGNCRPVDGVRPDRQRWALRAGQPPMGNAGFERGEQSGIARRTGSLCPVSSDAPRGALCRSNPIQAASFWRDGRGNHQALEHPVEQAEGEVWDVLNAGPLQRFTANGRLVHNCLILDHSDTTLRLGFVTDIHHQQLDDGKPKIGVGVSREREAKLPKECKKCAFLKPAGVHKCPSCGFAPERQSKIEEQGGALVQLRGKKAGKEQATSHSRQEFWSMLLWMRENRDKSAGWTKARFHKRFDGWPNGLHDRPVEPDSSFLRWNQAQNIAYAKQRDAARRRAAAGELNLGV